MRIFGLFLCLCGIVFGATSLTQNSITWTFDGTLVTGKPGVGEYQYGQYVNGDYWILGPVNITAIDPAPALSSGRYINGSMVNPTPGTAQGFDSSLSGFNIALMKGLAADLPLTVATNSSFISTASKTAAAQRPFQDHTAILTVVAAAPASGAFRPPYCGSTKTSSFNETDLGITGDYYDHLARLAVKTGSGQYTPSTVFMTEPWLMFRTYSSADYIAPAYGSDLAMSVGGVCMMLNSDYTNAQKRLYLIKMVQLGIDNKGIVGQNIYGVWTNDGGKSNGRKLPILFAGLILNDAGMLAIGNKSGDYIGARTYPNRTSEIPSDYVHYGEDDQTFYVAAYDVSWTNSAAWNPDDRDVNPQPYATGNIGLPEFGIRHATYPEQSDNIWATAYRVTSGKCFPIEVLVARIMGLKTYWNHNAFFDYTDRHCTYYLALSPSYGNINEWTRTLWNDYRDDYPDAPSGLALGAVGNKSVNELAALTFTLTASGGTAPYIYSATYQGGALPTGATLKAASFDWTPGDTQSGTYVITFTVTDAAAATSSEIVTITVNNTSSPIAPVITAIPAQTATTGTAFSLTPSATKDTGRTLTWTISGVPPWVTAGFSSSTGAISATPPAGRAGHYLIRLTATDDASPTPLSHTVYFNLTVLAAGVPQRIIMTR